MLLNYHFSFYRLPLSYRYARAQIHTYTHILSLSLFLSQLCWSLGDNTISRSVRKCVGYVGEVRMLAVSAFLGRWRDTRPEPCLPRRRGFQPKLVPSANIWPLERNKVPPTSDAIGCLCPRSPASQYRSGRDRPARARIPSLTGQANT